MNDFHIFDDPVIFQIGALPVTRTILTTLGVSAVLTGFAAMIWLTLRTRPNSTLATVGEMLVSGLDDLVSDIVGRRIDWLGSFSGSLFLFITACNLSGQLPGISPPTANLITTSALAIVVFLAVPIVGISSRGFWGYLRHYFSPNPILFPLHLISEFSRTLALAVRLFGNIMSGHLIVALLVALAGVLVPTPLMALDLLISLLQAYIFTLLSTVYVGAALRGAES
ncbi:MAG: F0F1 ATP synthase subunit A [Planctomycetaceae bacterium]|nr:F0F1 ATP synthase subunit A [Planctomycetaceae bacterium]